MFLSFLVASSLKSVATPPTKLDSMLISCSRPQLMHSSGSKHNASAQKSYTM